MREIKETQTEAANNIVFRKTYTSIIYYHKYSYYYIYMLPVKEEKRKLSLLLKF